MSFGDIEDEMTVEVKICGIKTAEALDAALDAGADYFGLVFYPRSPRNVGKAEARALIERARGRAKSVALLVNPTDQDIADIKREVSPDFIQLHGSESPERVAEIARMFNDRVIKAVRIENAADVSDTAPFRDVSSFVLYDAKPPKADATALPGGNGVPFDWNALAGLDDNCVFMLSGGLSPDNVVDAIAGTGARMVDVSSGVEVKAGEKDPTLIREFITAAKSATPIHAEE